MIDKIFKVVMIVCAILFIYLFYVQTYDISNEIYNLRMKIDDIDTELKGIR